MGRVLVTGGAGFIGSHVSRRLIERGHEVIVLDDLSKGIRHRLRSLESNQRFKFIEGTILDPEMLTLAARGVSCIVHMVAYKIPRYGDAYDTLVLNSSGMTAVLDVARKIGAKVVYASTSDVYGKSSAIPFTESGDLTVGPSTSRRWAYAISKLFDEHLAFAYSDRYGVPVVGLRYYGTYGPEQYIGWWGGPQGLFIQAAIEDKPCDIHGDGLQTRCYTYIQDAAELTVRAVERDDVQNEIINVGFPEEVSVLDLVERIHRLLGKSPKLSFIEYSSFSKNYEDVRRRVPDPRKCLDLLGPISFTSLDDGLTKTIAWQSSIGGALHFYDRRGTL